MAFKEIAIEKLYYTISEVAEQLGVNASLLRYWETEFIIIQPKKTKKGDRLYTKQDIENIKVIYHLVKEKGFTIDGAKKHLKENKHPHKTLDMLSLLKKIRTNLVALKEQL